LSSEETSQDYVLVRSTEADLDAVMEIEHLAFSTPWVREAFVDELTRPWARLEVLRQKASNRVVAFCNYWLVSDELHILNIAVHPNERRHGHASRLLAHIVSEAHRASFRLLMLEVRVSNTAAQALYRKFGFREIGRRPKYYADTGEDALLMDLELSN
jgi:ribosomal-protein-alanine N-acetyltransferase